MDSYLPRPLRILAACLIAFIALAFSPLLLALVPRPDAISATVLAMICWAVAFWRGSGIRETVTNSVSHGQRVLNVSPLTSTELFDARVVTPAQIRVLVSSVGVGLLASVVIGMVPAVVLAANLALIQYSLQKFGMSRIGVPGTVTNVRRVALILVVDVLISTGTLALLLRVLRSSNDSAVLRAFELGPQAVLLLVLVVLAAVLAIGARRTVPSVVSDTKARWWGSDRSLEFAHLLRDPHAFVNVIDSLPGLGIYVLFAVVAARAEAKRADVFILAAALVGAATAFFELLDDIFEPSRNRIVRSRSFDTELLDGIAAYRYQILYWVSFVLLAPFVFIHAVSSSAVVPFLAGGLAVAAMICASVATVSVYAAIKLSDLTTGYREHSNTGLSVSVLKSIVFTAGAPLGMVLLAATTLVQSPGVLGSAGMLCVAGVVVFALPQIVPKVLRGSVWSVS